MTKMKQVFKLLEQRREEEAVCTVIGRRCLDDVGISYFVEKHRGRLKFEQMEQIWNGAKRHYQRYHWGVLGVETFRQVFHDASAEILIQLGYLAEEEGNDGNSSDYEE